jgi:hypothetical protein
MKELLIANGWVHFRTGCSCNGSPRFYKNSSFFDYTIIVRNNKFSIKKGHAIIASGLPGQLENKMKQYELIKETDTEDKSMEA